MDTTVVQKCSIHNFDHSTLSQEQFNYFSFKYLNNPRNCRLNQDLSDFEQICDMKNDFSNSKQCQFCRFRRTFFIFKIPALALFAEMKVSDENNDQQQHVAVLVCCVLRFFVLCVEKFRSSNTKQCLLGLLVLGSCTKIHIMPTLACWLEISRNHWAALDADVKLSFWKNSECQV